MEHGLAIVSAWSLSHRLLHFDGGDFGSHIDVWANGFTCVNNSNSFDLISRKLYYKYHYV